MINSAFGNDDRDSANCRDLSKHDELLSRVNRDTMMGLLFLNSARRSEVFWQAVDGQRQRPLVQTARRRQIGEQTEVSFDSSRESCAGAPGIELV